MGFNFNINIWVFVSLLIICFVAGFLVCFLWIRRQMKKLEKAMKDPQGLEKLIRDPRLRKQMEEFKKRFSGGI